MFGSIKETPLLPPSAGCFRATRARGFPSRHPPLYGILSFLGVCVHDLPASGRRVGGRVPGPALRWLWGEGLLGPGFLGVSLPLLLGLSVLCVPCGHFRRTSLGLTEGLLFFRLQVAAVGNVPHFLRYLSAQLHWQVPGGLVLWYDSVVSSGQVKWQDELNEQNR